MKSLRKAWIYLFLDQAVCFSLGDEVLEKGMNLSLLGPDCLLIIITLSKHVAQCWAFVVWVWVSASQRILLSVLVWNPHKGLARETSHKTRRGRGKARSQNRTVDRRKQSAEKEAISRIGQSVGESSWQKSRKANGHRKATAWTCGPRGRVGQRQRMSRYSWWLCGSFARFHAHRCTESYAKVSQTSPFLHLKLTQVSDCFSFLPPSWLYFVCL